MKKIIKIIISLCCAICIIFSSNITVSMASEPNSDSEIIVTDEICIEMAENFAEAVMPNIQLYADNPIKLYKESGQAIGYVVNYYTNDQSSYGYIIFDNTNKDVISEYSFGHEAKSPYEMINQNSELSFSNRSASKLVKIDQFTYGLENCSTGTIIDNFGNESEAESNMQPFSSEAYDPTTWEEVIMDVSDVYEDYTLVSQNNLESFISYDDSYVIRYTGSYACAISALINCADYYGVLNYNDFAGDYETLWDLSGTSTEYRNGIAYGSTNIYDIGPAFVYFCQNRGVSIRENTVSFPDYNFFKTCIDDGDMALLHAGIFDANDQERSGHTMTVEGYATLLGYDTGKTIHTLMIADGWNGYVRYVNLDYTGWMDIRGTQFFS